MAKNPLKITDIMACGYVRKVLVKYEKVCYNTFRPKFWR